MWNLSFLLVNALDWGEGCSRPHIIGTDMCDVSSLPTREPIDANLLLDAGARAPRGQLECVVAAEFTKDPPQVVDLKGKPRQLRPGEADRVMGYAPGVSSVVGLAARSLQPAERRRLIGQGFAYTHMYHVLQRANPPTVVQLTRLLPIGSAMRPSQDQFEQDLFEMGRSARMQ